MATLSGPGWDGRPANPSTNRVQRFNFVNVMDAVSITPNQPHDQSLHKYNDIIANKQISNN